MGKNQLEVKITFGNVGGDWQSLELNIECQSDVSLAIEFLERMYNKSTEGKLTIPTLSAQLTPEQAKALNMITPIGEQLEGVSLPLDNIGASNG